MSPAPTKQPSSPSTLAGSPAGPRRPAAPRSSPRHSTSRSDCSRCSERRLGEAVAGGPARARRAADPARRIAGGPDRVPRRPRRCCSAAGSAPRPRRRGSGGRARARRSARARAPSRRRPGRRAPGSRTAWGSTPGMLPVGDHEVEAGQRAELEQLRRPELLEERPDARLAGGQFLAEPVRSRHGARLSARRERSSRTV